MKLIAKKRCSYGGRKFFAGDEIPADIVLNVEREEKLGVISIANDEAGVPEQSGALYSQEQVDKMMADAVANASKGFTQEQVDEMAAHLTDIDYVTGTSDALNTQSIMDMIFAVQPEAKTIGLLYSNSEANSTTPIAEAKAYLDAKGIAYVEKTGNTNDEIMTAANALVGQVDAVFTPTDNVVMAAAAAVSETLTNAGIPFYTGADSFVTAGAFATCGVNYTELGTYTADMALDILETGTVPEYHVMDGGIITVNTETAAALDLDYSAFNDLAGTVVEVETTAE